ncbi:pro-Pol polyprotein [Trichonephila inaurata madagascariensis]|uniref:Pro-Pol polyprotein n=1 Tax=Trichonephila inaurata madagascariensis TaxID=2747483 RepID=A0A8X6JYW4_9ARAC|nr:pro-Pol polyprotein [Trichonephila inaurata madagascariensis]
MCMKGLQKLANQASEDNFLTYHRRCFGHFAKQRFSVHFKIIQRLLYCEENIQLLQIATCILRGNRQVERIHRTLIPVLTKLSLDDSKKWYKYVDKLQRILNRPICRSTKWTPFKLLIGTKMRNKEDIRIKDLLLEEMAEELQEQGEFLRNDAKKNFETIQSENRKTLYNKRRKDKLNVQEGDLVAIK